jgi:hypothetical protein
VGTALMVAALAGCGGGNASQPSAESSTTPQRSAQLRAERQHRHKQVAERQHRREVREISEAEEIAKRARRRKAARRRAREHAAQASTSGVAPFTERLYRQWTGVDRDNFQLAYEICGSQPMSQSAEEWETSDDPSSIAHAFGLEYREYARAPVEEGCLRAFADSHAQWEAELEAHSKL